MKSKKTETRTSAREKTAKPIASRDETENHSNETQKQKDHARKWISILLIIVGVLLIMVPLIMTYINSKRNEAIIDQFLKEAQQVSAEDIVVPVLDETPEPEETQMESPEPSGEEETEESAQDVESTPSAASAKKKPLMSAEEIQRRMTGVLIIKKINLKMIIMDGVDEETLRVAAGRMPETGNFDEIGNVVLAGHRSYTFGKYFNRLDELEPGDKIVVQTKGKTLEYEVYKKHIIEPDDLSILEQGDTEKILTLFTCHPVVIANKRLVIHARQIN